MNQDQQQVDFRATILCRNFRKYGNCKKQGCPYQHSITDVKPKALKRVFSGNNTQSKNFQGNQFQQDRNHFNQQNNFSNNNRSNFQSFNHQQSNQQNQGQIDYKFDKFEKRENNYNTQNSFYEQRQQNNYQNNQSFDNRNNNFQQSQLQQSLIKQTIGLQLLGQLNQENLKGFLQIINTNNQYCFGLIYNQGINFYPYTEQIGIDILKIQNFTLPYEIEDAFIQQYNLQYQKEDKYCLIVIIKEAILYSALIFPDFINNQQNYVKISDISNTQLKNIRVHIQSNELFTFSSDGFARIFSIGQQQSYLKNHAQLNEVIFSVHFLGETIKTCFFLVITKQGNFYQFINNTFTKVHSLVDQILLDSVVDFESKRVYFVTKQKENFNIYFINQNNIVEGPIYTYRFPITKIIGFKDFDQINCILLSDNRGQLDILKEQQQTDQIKFLRQTQYKQQMGEINKFMFFKMTNANQVIEKMLFVQRIKDKFRTEGTNFEFYRFYQIF